MQRAIPLPFPPARIRVGRITFLHVSGRSAKQPDPRGQAGIGVVRGTHWLIGSEVTWISSDPSIATVKNGMVTGVHAGEAKIFSRCNVCDDRRRLESIPSGHAV
jgi:hypothetical protein